MKFKFIFSLAIVATAASLFSCTKDAAATGGGTTDSVTVLVRDSMHGSDPHDTQVSDYIYNSSHQLIKVNYKDYLGNINNYDTTEYSGGYAVKVLSISLPGGTVTDSSRYYYTGSVLDSVNTADIGGPDNQTSKFYYAAGKVDSISVITYQGTNNGPTKVSHIVFVGNDFHTAIVYDPTATPVTISVDAYPNPYYGLIFSKSSDFLQLFNANNITGIVGASYNAGTYTYLNGRTVTMTNSNSTFTTDYIYAKIP